MQPRLSLRNITKRYPGIVANDGISLDIMPGEVLAVLGENGAGKSTLMKIIYGSVRQDEGTVEFDGRPLEISSPAEARALGIAMVHQHFALFDTLTVAENISLGLTKHRPLPEIASEVERLGKKYGLEVDPSAVVYALSMGERQRVEIIRALMTSPQLLILDEPTSVLVPQAVHKLFATLHRLASEGVSILFISHKLDEIRELADRCVVLRAGRIITSVNPKEESEESLARLMIGAEPPKLQAPSGEPGETIFELRDVTVPATLRACGLNNVSLSVRKGEIVGIAGISGNGQARLMSVGSGEMLVNPDAVRLFGESVGACGTKARRMRGLRYVPEQRLGHAAVPEISLQTNTYLTGDSFVRRGFILQGKARRFTDTVIERFHVKTPSPQSPAGSLSGGAAALAAGPETGHWYVLVVLAASAAGGAVWGAITALLRHRFHANEILVSLMLVYVAQFLLSWAVQGPMRDPAGFGFPQTRLFEAGALMPLLVPGTRLHIGFVLALLAAFAVWILMDKMEIGMEFKISGMAPLAARYAGYRPGHLIWVSLLISGALAGLAGGIEAAGPLGQLTPTISPGYGFAAIIVAFAGRLTPLGCIPASFIMALFYLGGELAQSRLGLPSSITGVYQGLLLFFILACDTMIFYRVRWLGFAFKEAEK